MKTACLYVGLDPVLTSVQGKTSYKNNIRELKKALIYYDRVFFPKEWLFENSVALPVLQFFSPFVKKGYLWASTDEPFQSPRDFIYDRATRYVGDDLSKGLTRASARYLKQEVKDWESLAPEKFEIVLENHDVINQLTSHLLRLDLDKEDSSYRTTLIIFLQKMSSEGRGFERNYILSKLLYIWDIESCKFLQLLISIVHCAYYKYEVSSQKYKSVLFPCEQVQNLSAFTEIKDYIGVEPLEDFERLGINLEEILELPINKLFVFVTSEEWKQVRQCLKKFSPYSTELKNLRRLLNRNMADKKDLDISSNVPFSKSLAILSNGWIFSSLALSKKELLTHTEPDKEDVVYFDPDAWIVSYKGKQVRVLSKWSIELFNLLSVYEDRGVLIEMVKQLDSEMTSLKHREDYSGWHSQCWDSDVFKESCLNRINVRKNSLNRKLSPLGVEVGINNEKGIWKIVCAGTGNNLMVKSFSSISKSIENREMPGFGIRYDSINRLIWIFCINHLFVFFSYMSLVKFLKNRWEKEFKCDAVAVSKLMYRFSKKLDGTGFKIVSDKQGNYCFVYKE